MHYYRVILFLLVTLVVSPVLALNTQNNASTTKIAKVTAMISSALIVVSLFLDTPSTTITSHLDGTIAQECKSGIPFCLCAGLGTIGLALSLSHLLNPKSQRESHELSS